MWSSGSTSSDLAKGKKFLEKLQYVQHVDQEKKTASEITEQILQDLLADREVWHDYNLTGNTQSNLDILKSSLKDRVTQVRVYSNPLPISRGSSPRVAFHAFVVFVTRDTPFFKNEMWWSLEKNGRSIVLQQSTEKDDVLKKLYDADQKKSDERYGEVKFKKSAMGNFRCLEDFLRVIWETNQIIDPYHLLYSNCQHFASFIFKKLNGEREKWSTDLSAIFGRLSGRKKKTAIELNTVMYKSILQDDKFDYCKAMIDGRRKDFEELTNNLTFESLNSVDSQGYTLLQWATVYSTTDWPIAELLKDKGAQISSNEELFRRDVFFIALQYLPPYKRLKLFDSFDEIDVNGVNGTGDTALHLALYGEKWGIAEKILNQYENYDVNLTNSLGETALHLAAKLNCEIGLFTKILFLTNSENVNKADGIGNTALHYAIDEESGSKVKELLKHTDVDVNVQNNEDYCTVLHLASKWPTIPVDLFRIILQKSTDINAQDVNGNTALHYAIMTKFETAVEELLKHTDVNVTNNQNAIALHLACICENFPMDLFKQILEKTNDINAKDEDEATALHYAILKKSETAVKELLNHKCDVNIKNKDNRTALHLACKWNKDMPMDLFNLILEKSDDVNAQDKDGNTALHFAIVENSKTKVVELLAHTDVNVDIKSQFNFTPLHLAARCQSIPKDLFQIILEKSSNINAHEENSIGIKQIKSLCTNTKIIDGMTLHKLPLKIESTFEGASSIVKRFSFGEPDTWTSRKIKTILLIGETGSGKTTMINAMINYVLGVEWDDPFRFVLIDEQVMGASQAHSQTQIVAAYDIYYREGFRIPFSLTIVDTPGFGDIGGNGRDQEITSAVQEFFQNSNGIQELDAVGFVVQSSMARLIPSQTYIFYLLDWMLEIFGKDIERNILFFTTFADGNLPLVLEAIKKAKLPCMKDANGSPYHQSFNNGAIYKSNNSANSKRFRMDWEDGTENFKLFFDQLTDMPTKSLQMTGFPNDLQ